MSFVSPHATTDWAVVAVFAAVYLGMFPGGLPRLKLDCPAWRCWAPSR